MFKDTDTTVFVHRDAAGKVCGVYRRAQELAPEHVAAGMTQDEVLADGAEVNAFEAGQDALAAAALKPAPTLLEQLEAADDATRARIGALLAK